MFCEECGAKLPEAAPYCWRCGTAQPPDFFSGSKFMVIKPFQYTNHEGEELHWRPGEIFDPSKYSAQGLEILAGEGKGQAHPLLKAIETMDEQNGLVFFADGERRSIQEIITA